MSDADKIALLQQQIEALTRALHEMRQRLDYLERNSPALLRVAARR
jgi:prefoldin subunit 5